MSTKKITIASLDDVARAADEFVQAIDQSTVFAFFGSMGAGKTTFISAVARA